MRYFKGGRFDMRLFKVKTEIAGAEVYNTMYNEWQWSPNIGAKELIEEDVYKEITELEMILELL